jgi:hypothetical protein
VAGSRATLVEGQAGTRHSLEVRFTLETELLDPAFFPTLPPDTF